MSEQDETPAIDPEIAPLVDALAAVELGDPRDERQLLEELDAKAAAIVDVVGARARAERLDGLRAEIGRLRESAVAGPEALGALRGKIGEARKALGIEEVRTVRSAADRVLARLTAPPLLHVPTGIQSLDDATRGGLLSRRVHVIGGEPDAGKTALLVQILLHQAGLGYACAMHCVDEPGDGIEDRIGQAWGAELDDMEAGREGAILWLADSLRLVPQLVLVDQEEDGFTIEDTAEMLLAHAKRLGCKGATLAIDSLQTAKCRGMTGPGAPRDDRQRIELVTSVLRGLARRGLLVIVTSELGRAAYKESAPGRGRAQPSEMAAFKGSGSIEYMMTTGMVLSRLKRGEFTGDTRVALPKNKRGESGVVFRLERDRDRCTYTDRGRILTGDEKGEADEPTKKPSPGVDAKIVERARAALFLHPAGISGGLDGWATLCGNIPKGRLACKFLLAAEEAEAVQVEGVGRVYRRKGATPAKPLPAICPICKGMRGGAPGQCLPCKTCDGCKHATVDQGGCACF